MFGPGTAWQRQRSVDRPVTEAKHICISQLFHGDEMFGQINSRRKVYFGSDFQRIQFEVPWPHQCGPEAGLPFPSGKAPLGG